MKICPVCKKEVEHLTKDHIVPKWLKQRIHMLGVPMARKVNVGWTQWICLECNAKKGGDLDYKHPVVRKIVQEIIDCLQAGLDETR